MNGAADRRGQRAAGAPGGSLPRQHGSKYECGNGGSCGVCDGLGAGASECESQNGGICECDRQYNGTHQQCVGKNLKMIQQGWGQIVFDG